MTILAVAVIILLNNNNLISRKLPEECSENILNNVTKENVLMSNRFCLIDCNYIGLLKIVV